MSKKISSKKELSAAQRDELIKILKYRFEKKHEPAPGCRMEKK
jgi:F0F1-type ATP synthase delta subunit